MVGRGLGWQNFRFKKNLKEEEKYSEINLKKGNPAFLPKKKLQIQPYLARKGLGNTEINLIYSLQKVT